MAGVYRNGVDGKTRHGTILASVRLENELFDRSHQCGDSY